MDRPATETVAKIAFDVIGDAMTKVPRSQQAQLCQWTANYAFRGLMYERGCSFAAEQAYRFADMLAVGDGA